jgi:cell fate regulator YaaT (PSP1 superfamily)
VTHLVEVAFRGNRKEFFQWEAESAPALRTGVIVDADRGEDFGRVHSTGELAELRCRGCAHGCGTTPPPRQILRLATAEDVALDEALTAENESARKRAMERVKANHLVMKLADAEWQFDRRKLTFYFTAERRVDFRTLVRDLAAMFRARIELKQIGVRDEAKRLSGIGRCGREYCSASWLPDLRPVNLGVAKDQKLSLNPQQISGACGRLMCCLRYEHEFYVQSRRRFPKEGRILVTSRGEEKVIACDIFNDRVTLRSAEGDTRVAPLAELRDDVGGFGESPSVERATTSVALRSEALMEDDDAESMLLDDEPPRVSEASRAPRVVPTVPVAPAPADPSFASLSDGPTTTSPSTIAGLPRETASPLAGSTGADRSADGVNDASPDASPDVSPDVSPDATEPSADQRRKRRRGRRGGRRLRAAEQRRQELGADVSDSDASDADAADREGAISDTDDDVHDDESSSDSPATT